MLPIYTRYLTPEDYGTIELLAMLIDVATIIFGARMLYTMEHYGWSEKLSSIKLVSPGDLTSMQDEEKILIIEEAHTNPNA